MLGLLLINKPAGITSYGAVAKVKRLSGEKRIGHTGTLDPMATGVLPVFLGRATVLSSYLLMSDKGYTAKAKLGITTDTLDITGKTEEVKDVCVGDEELTRVLSSFVGESLQKPPMFSALKKDGQRLYDLARKGEKIDIPARNITVHSINLLSPLDKNNEFSFETTVSKGTYIRSLVRDIGEKLGTGATLTELVRTKTAGFKIEDCVNLNELTNENIKKYIPKFLLFGVIVFPTGILWEVRNMVKFGMPFNYIPPVGEQLNAGLAARLFDIRTRSVYPCLISNGDDYDEYNVFLGLFKTSLFDDANLGLESANINLFAVILFISALILAIISFVATILILKDRKGIYDMAFEHKLLFGVLYASLIISYFSFALGSDNYSAMNFRYIALLIVVEAVFLGVFADALRDKQHIRFRLFAATVLAFAAASASTYILLGFAR